MKTIKAIALVAILIWTNLNFAQTIVVGGSPLNLPCGGGNVNLTALGNSSVPVFGDNFNVGSVAPGWLASPAAQFNNPCGASMDGTTYLWMGPATAAPRTMQTATVNVACGGTVCFDFKFTCESCGDNSPCEGADLYNEGVSLQWSIGGGGPWTDMAYFAPNGNLLGAYPGAVTSPSASGATPFTIWQNYCFNIPAAAYSANTSFRLRQWGSSGATFDHWGLDNFYVYATPCVPFYYDWAHIAGAPNSANVTTSVTSTTTFTCCYTNGTLSACANVTVNVATMVINTLNFTSPTCLSGSNGTMNVTVTGGTGPFNYVLTGPTNVTNTTGVFTGLQAGLYTITIDDATTCLVTQNFTILPGPPCCSVTASSTPALCFGGATGTATANPTGGVGPYTYVWFNGAVPIGQTTQTASGLVAGTYNVTTTDALGCQANVIIVVGQPAATLNATKIQTNVSCFGGCNASITVNLPTGGTAPYMYNINGGTYQAGANFPGLCAGNYNITVRDANNCVFTFPVTVITQPADLTLVQNSITPTTCGGSNGGVTVTAGGGTTIYTYSIPGSPNNTTGIFTGLTAGGKIVTVTDANGCTETLNITILAAAGPVPSISILNNVACAGALTGSVTIAVVGGTAPFQYKLDAGANQPSNTFSFVSAGAHSVTVTDANGCTGLVNFNITQPTALTFSSVAVAATCNGTCNGQITVTANNATPPYTYSSNNGLSFQVSNILTGLCAGNINVVVKDANGCLANAVVNIAQPAVLNSVQATIDPVCYQTPTGQISFAPIGGTGPYTFSINNGSTFSIVNPVTGLMAGVYDVVVKDIQGCEFDAQVTLTDPPPFDFTFVANNPSNCGAQDGSFEIVASNGVGPYNYSINGLGGSTTQLSDGFFLNLFSGLYNLVVDDANGCVDSVYSALSDNVMITQVDFTQDVTCFNGTDGIAIISQQFGTPFYTYLITPAVQPINFDGNYFGLPAGNYFVTVTDNGLCIGIQPFTINQPDSITFTPLVTDATCNGGSNGQINASAAIGGNGGPYQYSINGGAFQASPIFAGLFAGSYDILIMDGNGCLGGDQIDVDEPNAFNLIINPVDLVCNGVPNGILQMLASGSNPGTYNYNIGIANNNFGTFSNLAATNYVITITDVLGCTFVTNQVIAQPPLLVAAYVVTDALCNGVCNGIVDVVANGGTPVYTYSSDGGVTLQPGASLTGLCDGNHTIYVKDDNDCVVQAVQLVSEPTLLTMTFASNPATCGLNNGNLTINANNGTPVYEYSVNLGAFQVSNVFAGLAAGNHNVVLQDQNNCEISGIAVIANGSIPVIDNVDAVNPLCFGNANGSITITSSAGVGVHQYSITGGAPFQASNVFNGLTAGVYNVVVQDANLCIATTTVTLTAPPVLGYNVLLSNLTCNGNSSGEIELTGTGGTPAYEYSINGGATFQGGGTFSFIGAGPYNIQIRDDNNCLANGVEVLTEPAPLTFTTFTIQDPNCNGVCNGTVTTVTAGGTGVYTYNWSGNIAGNASPNATSICAGTYSMILTDANGCQIDSLNFVLNEPPAVPITSVLSTDLLCFNVPTGTITINAPTAVQYSINGGVSFQASNTFNALDTGNYDIVVEDATGCQSTSNITIYEPTQVYSLAPSNWFGCFGADVVVQAFTNGGTVPYTYLWTNNLDATTQTTDMFNYTITLPAPGIDFTLVATDDNGCVALPITYNVSSSPPLVAVAGNDTTICLVTDATLYVNASGGELIDFGPYLGYNYSWNTGVASDTLQFASVSPSVQTTYTVTVTDLCNQVVTDDMVVSLFVDPIPDVIGGGNGCLPELFAFTNPSYIAGGSCLWDFGDGNTSTSCAAVDNLYTLTGCFDVSLTVTSTDGCIVTNTYADLVCINPLPTPGFYWNPDSPSILDPTIQVINTADNAVFWEYNFAGLGASFDPQPEFVFPETATEMTYSVCQKVTSVDGCIATLCQDVFVHEEIIFYVPNIFTPDGDEHNQTFKPVVTSGVDMFNYHLTVFNRWGEIVFESFNYDFGWDGTYGDQGLVADGVYVWQIEFGEKLTDKRQNHRGHVTVLK